MIRSVSAGSGGGRVECQIYNLKRKERGKEGNKNYNSRKKRTNDEKENKASEKIKEKQKQSKQIL